MALVVAGSAAYVLYDRAHVEHHIKARQANYTTCAREYPGARHAKARKSRCGWSELTAIRQGDVLGLPFIIVAIGAFLVLAYHSRPTETESTAK